MSEIENETLKPRDITLFGAAVVCGKVSEIESFFEQVKKGPVKTIYLRASAGKLFITDSDPRTEKEVKPT